MQVVDAVETRTAPAGGDARRTKAHARARRHSGQVRRLRRIIPVVAGGAVLLVAGLTLLNPFGAAVTGVSVGPVSLAGTKVKMENPRLSGFRKGDRGYEVTASAALQDMRRPSLIELEAMRGHIATDDKGGLARLEAASGLFDSSRESLTLERDIRIWTDKGEEARLRSAAVDFKTGSVRSAEPVTVTVPSGSVTGDSLDVVESGKVISFVGNVHAVFHAADKPRPADAKPEAPAARVLTSAAEPEDGRR
ncbi:LPS export ABC transporter periplasmic protein LptC [Methylobacterium sp. A54F]